MKDKIIFWITADLMYFCLAKLLKNKHDCDLFAVIDVPNKPKKFFKEQDIVKFQKTWFYHDHILKKKNINIQYLSSFEKKYGINLWLLAHNERIFYKFNQFYRFSNEEILSILEQECRLFETIIDEAKPDFLIMYTSGLHHDHLFYEICKYKGVKPLILRSTPFGYRFMISNDPEKIDSFDIMKKSELVSDELTNYLKVHDSSTQNTQYLSTFQKSRISYVKAAAKFLLSDNKNEKTHYTYYGRTKLKVLIKTFLSVLKKRYREYFMNRTFLREINNEMPFVYFPLHLEQERVLLIGAPFYTNQIEMIKHIAQSLPVGYQLFVKEHPMMNIREWRSIAEYKQILEIPNVTLIHHSINSEDILRKCSLVITINGTSSLEAAFHGKPSIIFTDMDFSSLPSVTRVKSIEELPSAIKTSLQKKIDTNALNDYVNLINKNSFELDLNGLIADMQNYFNYGGFLVDVEISSQKVKTFLDKQSSIFEKLALEHIKKMKQYKEHEMKK